MCMLRIVRCSAPPVPRCNIVAPTILVWYFEARPLCGGAAVNNTTAQHAPALLSNRVCRVSVCCHGGAYLQIRLALCVAPPRFSRSVSASYIAPGAHLYCKNMPDTHRNMHCMRGEAALEAGRMWGTTAVLWALAPQCAAVSMRLGSGHRRWAMRPLCAMSIRAKWKTVARGSARLRCHARSARPLRSRRSRSFLASCVVIARACLCAGNTGLRRH